MKLSTISDALSVKRNGADVTVTGLSTDTRTLQPGDLYVAIKGPQFDGHAFVADVKHKGAVAAVVDRPIDVDIPTLQVEDTVKFLGQYGAWCRQQVSIPIVAITGSCGKTTTRSMIASIFATCGKTLTAEKNYNNQVGVPLTLSRLTKDHQYAVIEMGADSPGEIAYLTEMTRPTIATITNAAQGHLQGFGSVDDVAKAKGEIFDGLPDDGVAVINADSTYAEFWQGLIGKRRSLTFGLEKPATVSAKDITMNAKGHPTFTLCLSDDSVTVTLNVMGKHNVMNALTATAVTHAAGFSLENIKTGLESVEPVNRRLALQKGYKQANIIDDSYNANPLSSDAALEVLAQYPHPTFFVLGDMLGLAEDAERFHAELGKKAKQLGIHRIYAVGKLSRLAAETFGDNGFAFEDKQTLIESIRKDINANTTVLVKGSNGSKMNEVVANIIDA